MNAWMVGYVFFSTALFMGIIIILIRQLNEEGNERTDLINRLVELAQTPPIFLPQQPDRATRANQIPEGTDAEWLDYMEQQERDASALEVEGADE